MLSKEQLTDYINKSSLKESLGMDKKTEISLDILGQGEYNLNYSFWHPGWRKKLVLRINTGSQMHLERQIEYEYNALKLLADSGRTPSVYFVDGSKQYLPYGVLVMEFLEGRPLDYESDMEMAAEILADIHSVPVPENHSLVSPGNPRLAMLEECQQMAAVYLNWEKAERGVRESIQRLLKKAEQLVPKQATAGFHLINTELNSGNFLIGGEGAASYLIDWEKPLLGQVEQDLGHFLSPTTTFWKTDCILNRSQMDAFIQTYKRCVGDRFGTDNIEQNFESYLVLTCLRGTTWCSMAYVEYQNPGRALRNEFTYQKIKKYLDQDFLDYIEQEYFTN